MDLDAPPAPMMPGTSPMWRRLLPALVLLLMAPLTAEILSGYDDSTGNLGEILGSLFLFAPLYGGAGLLIREVTRRTGRGWVTVLLLGLAFGVLEAGLIDHSMFNPSYRDISGWAEVYQAFDVRALGLNPILAISFTVGHMIGSIAVPIAVVESLFPRLRTTPWVGRFGLGVIAVFFALAAGAVLGWHLDTEDFVPSAGQVAGSAVVVVALIAAAFVVPRRASRPSTEQTVSPMVAGAFVFAGLIVYQLVNGLLADRWAFLMGGAGFVADVTLLVALFLVLSRWARRRGWGPSHHLAVAGGALLVPGVMAFIATPIGDVSPVAKYLHNTVGLVAAILLILAAGLRTRLRETDRNP